MSDLPNDHREFFQAPPGTHPSDDDPCAHEFGPDGHCENCGEFDEECVDPDFAEAQAEAAWERFQERYFGGSEPVTLDEQHRAAWEEHREAHRR